MNGWWLYLSTILDMWLWRRVRAILWYWRREHNTFLCSSYWCQFVLQKSIVSIHWWDLYWVPTIWYPCRIWNAGRVTFGNNWIWSIGSKTVILKLEVLLSNVITLENFDFRLTLIGVIRWCNATNLCLHLVTIWLGSIHFITNHFLFCFIFHDQARFENYVLIHRISWFYLWMISNSSLPTLYTLQETWHIWSLHFAFILYSKFKLSVNVNVIFLILLCIINGVLWGDLAGWFEIIRLIKIVL